MNERMTESERAALCRRIDELCAEVEALKRDEWAAGFSAGCDAVEAAYEDGRPFYEVENAKLRSMRDTWQENDAKLREMVADMWRSAMVNCDFAARLAFADEFVDRMRELGVEVQDA